MNRDRLISAAPGGQHEARCESGVGREAVLTPARRYRDPLVRIGGIEPDVDVGVAALEAAERRGELRKRWSAARASVDNPVGDVDPGARHKASPGTVRITARRTSTPPDGQTIPSG